MTDPRSKTKNIGALGETLRLFLLGAIGTCLALIAYFAIAEHVR